ncbi:MAG: hypothetical protein MZV70_17995 [Desulfobacterales bacterium]|nr:hypothetical protein [Desulfobacterales bacterium]
MLLKSLVEETIIDGKNGRNGKSEEEGQAETQVPRQAEGEYSEKDKNCRVKNLGNTRIQPFDFRLLEYKGKINRFPRRPRRGKRPP